MNANTVYHVDNLYHFSIIRYEPTGILLLEKHSKKAYTYHPLPQNIIVHPEITHRSLLRPLLHKDGALFLRGASTLGTLLEQRRRDYRPDKYSREELENTFSPLL